MKTRKNTTIKVITTLMITLMISTAILNAGYVKPKFNDNNTLTVNVDTKEQTFDEALLIGLQLLDQADENSGNGKIVIEYDGDKYTAVVSLKALAEYDVEKVDYATFIRNNVKFI